MTDGNVFDPGRIVSRLLFMTVIYGSESSNGVLSQVSLRNSVRASNACIDIMTNIDRRIESSDQIPTKMTDTVVTFDETKVVDEAIDTLVDLLRKRGISERTLQFLERRDPRAIEALYEEDKDFDQLQAELLSDGFGFDADSDERFKTQVSSLIEEFSALLADLNPEPDIEDGPDLRLELEHGKTFAIFLRDKYIEAEEINSETFAVDVQGLLMIATEFPRLTSLIHSCVKYAMEYIDEEEEDEEKETDTQEVSPDEQTVPVETSA